MRVLAIDPGTADGGAVVAVDGVVVDHIAWSKTKVTRKGEPDIFHYRIRRRGGHECVIAWCNVALWAHIRSWCEVSTVDVITLEGLFAARSSRNTNPQSVIMLAEQAGAICMGIHNEAGAAPLRPTYSAWWSMVYGGRCPKRGAARATQERYLPDMLPGLELDALTKKEAGALLDAGSMALYAIKHERYA